MEKSKIERILGYLEAAAEALGEAARASEHIGDAIAALDYHLHTEVEYRELDFNDDREVDFSFVDEEMEED